MVGPSAYDVAALAHDPRVTISPRRWKPACAPPT